MKMQYILTEDEYFDICNELDSLRLRVEGFYYAFTEEEKDRFREHCVSINQKIRLIHHKLNYVN